MIKVKPEKLAEYKKWHANPMPGVNEMIKECGLNNYSIYSRGEYLFTYFTNNFKLTHEFLSNKSTIGFNDSITKTVPKMV